MQWEAVRWLGVQRPDRTAHGYKSRVVCEATSRWAIRKPILNCATEFNGTIIRWCKDGSFTQLIFVRNFGHRIGEYTTDELLFAEGVVNKTSLL